MRQLLVDQVSHVLGGLAAPAPPAPPGGGVPNPAPNAPPGVEAPISNLMAYVKWGVLAIIVMAGFVGAGAIAGGRILAHHGASKIGMGILLSAIAGAVVYVSIYAILTSVTG